GDLEKTLAGLLDGNVLDGVFYGKDIIGSVSGPLAKALPFGAAGKVTQGGATSLGKKLPFGVTIENGVARLKNPIKISLPEAEMTFSGGMRVDGTLDLPGTVALAPATIAALTGGKVNPANPIPVNLKLIGPAWNPTAADLDLKPAVNQIVKEGGTALLGRAFGVDSSKAQQTAEQKAGQVQADAQKRAEAEAEAKRKKLEEQVSAALSRIQVDGGARVHLDGRRSGRLCPVPGCGEPGAGPRNRWFCKDHAGKLSAAEQKSILERNRRLAAEGKLPTAIPAQRIVRLPAKSPRPRRA